ncbi:MAG: hypothetical protein IPN92_00515 [Chromatiaceae bacterium]|nr:hypothetical protein [Chromatiaceae bacterium]
MNREEHPIWSVYDKLRTARLNVKYYSRRLQMVERLTFSLDLILLATAPSSAIAGLWFWSTSIGSLVWQYFGVIAAATAVVKPLLALPKKIKDYEGVLAGYRGLEYDLMEIKTIVEQKRTYDKTQQEEFRKAIRREKSLVSKPPETRENATVKRACEEEVLRELPSESFFVPQA